MQTDFRSVENGGFRPCFSKHKFVQFWSVNMLGMSNGGHGIRVGRRGRERVEKRSQFESGIVD